MAYAFDGPNKLIILDSTDPVSAVDLFSRWKDWVCDGNAQFAPAFRSVAGDPISSTQTIAPYLFLQNQADAGWRIRPAEANHTLRIVGNLVAEDPLLPRFAQPLGYYTVEIQLELSSAALAVTVSGEGGGDAPTAQEVATAVWGATAGQQVATRVDAAVSSRATPADLDLTGLATTEDLAPLATLTALEPLATTAGLSGLATAGDLTGLATATQVAAVAGQGLSSAQAAALLDLWAKLGEVHKLLGLDPSAPLVVTETERTAGAAIQQTITEASGTVTVERAL